MDLETGAVFDLWSRGPEYVRLAGFTQGGDIEVTTDIGRLVSLLPSAEYVIGHNILGFDLIALARHHGLDLEALAARGTLADTKLLAVLADPPPAKLDLGAVERRYSLDETGKRYLGAGKTDDLPALAKKYGGFDQIPVDDEEYRSYLRGDVGVTRDLAAHFLPMNDYARREHRIAAIAARVSLNGFRVDVPLLTERLEAGREKREQLTQLLVDRYGLPTLRKDGKPSKNPQYTQEGKEAIRKAFVDAGAPFMPKTAKTGRPDLSSTGLDRMSEHYGHIPAVADLIDVVRSLNGIRTVYETVNDHLVGDRVHPWINLRQASGRWSFSKPGLTVMGKRGGRAIEREIFLPEPGHLLVSVDLAQIDARAVAVHSQDKAYLALFQPGVDLHRTIAERIWGDPGRREDAKTISHGWNYGRGAKAIAKQYGIDLDDAYRFDSTMRDEFPDLVEWRSDMASIAQSGELLDNGFGRKMRPDRERGYTQGPALMGQGCARDLLMEGLLRLPAETLPMLRGVIHDEVVLSIPLDQVVDVQRAVVEALSFPWAPPGADYWIEIVAEHGRPGENWGDVYRKEPKAAAA